MTMKYKTIAYDSAKHILAMPDHYVPIARPQKPQRLVVW